MEDRQSGSQPKDISLPRETTGRRRPPQRLQPSACTGLPALEHQPDSSAQTGRPTQSPVQHRWRTEVWRGSPCSVSATLIQALAADSFLAAGKFAQNRRNAPEQKAGHPRPDQQLKPPDTEPESQPAITGGAAPNGADGIEHVDAKIEQWAGPTPNERDPQRGPRPVRLPPADPALTEDQ